jgi:carboxypeptidase Taq
MALSPFNHPVVREILELVKPVWAIEYASRLMAWDRETYMPSRGVEARSLAASELSVLRRRMILNPKLVELVEKAESRLEELNDYERGLVRTLSREIRIMKALPDEFVAKFARTATVASRVWAEAKKANDFNKFKPYLEEIVKLCREKAERLGYEKHPYDALVDLYEEGWTTHDVQQMFDRMLPGLRKILDKVLSDEFYPRKHPLEDREYDITSARRLVRKLLEVLGWDWNRGRLDESPHPFTMGLDVNDVRITVRFEGKDVRRAIYAVIHEFGHALYDLQIDPAIARTPIGEGASLGVHESQSRFWENIIGRSPWFVKAIKPVIDDAIAFTQQLNWLELYKYFNIVRPIPIRVESDELTYNLHIYLRFVLEKDMIAGEVNVDDLPELWNQMMEELLGIRPRTYSEGVLQDIHWSTGSIGYFPTYSLGNVIAAQIWFKVRSVFSDVAERISSLELGWLREWLRDNIHRWGKTYPPKQLVERVTGSPPDPKYLIEYLEWKFVKLPSQLEA